MEDAGSFRCSLCENQYSYEGTLKTHIMMMMHCKCFKCFTYDCNQCRQHLTQSLNTGGDNQQAFQLEREKGFESLNSDKRRSAKPDTKDFVGNC